MLNWEAIWTPLCAKENIKYVALVYAFTHSSIVHNPRHFSNNTLTCLCGTALTSGIYCWGAECIADWMPEKCRGLIAVGCTFSVFYRLLRGSKSSKPITSEQPADNLLSGNINTLNPNVNKLNGSPDSDHYAAQNEDCTRNTLDKSFFVATEHPHRD